MGYLSEKSRHPIKILHSEFWALGFGLLGLGFTSLLSPESGKNQPPIVAHAATKRYLGKVFIYLDKCQKPNIRKCQAMLSHSQLLSS